MKTFALCLLFLQLAVIRPALAGQVEDFFREQFKLSDIIYVGEFHTVAQHKEILFSLLQTLMMDDTIDGFAFEFSRYDDQQTLNQYFRDTDATPGSPKELEYFKHLNRSYSNMFNVKDYDIVMRLMKQIWINKQGKVNFCAVDARSVNPDDSDNGEKYQALKKLPQVVQNEISQISGKTIQQAAKESPAFDREASIGVNVANCFRHTKKMIAYVGMGHAMRTERILPTSWRTAARFTELALPGKIVKSALLAQGYFDPNDLQTSRWPMFSEKCLSSGLTQTVAYTSSSIPDALNVCVVSESPNGGQKISLAGAFDFVVFGPKGTKIAPEPSL